MGSISGDVWLQLNQLRQKGHDLSQINNISIQFEKYLKFFDQNSDLINTSIENNFIKQINDLKDIKDLGIDLTNRYTDDLNENNASISGQSSHQLLEVLPQRQEVPEVMSSDNESENGMKCEDNNDFEPKEETMDGFVDENEDLIDNKESIMRQMFDILEQKEDIDLEEDMESNETIDGSVDDNEQELDVLDIESEEDIKPDVNIDYQSNAETIDGSIVDNKESIMRQMFDILEEKEDIDSEEDMESNETIDGSVDDNEDTSDRQDLEVLFQSEDNTILQVIESDIDSEDGIQSDINGDYQQNVTIDGNIVENQVSIDRQELLTNEDNSHSNESQSNTELDNNEDINCQTINTTNEDKDRETEDNGSDEEVGDELDTDYRQRVKRVKTLKERFVCDFNNCRKSYSKKRNLTRHQLSHSGKRYFCDHKKCVKHFGDSSALNRHKMSKFHVLDELFKCCVNKCDYQTVNKDQLETHIASHPMSDRCNQRHDKSLTIDGKYECDFIGCHKKFIHSYDMLKHKRIHLDHTYRCGINGCDQTFTRPDYLAKHKASQHITKYGCRRKGCDYKTGNKWSFDKHLISHSNERHFKCSINNCDQSFKFKSHLIAHQLRVHPEDLPDKPWFECQHNGCQYKTKRKPDLNQHMKRHSK